MERRAVAAVRTEDAGVSHDWLLAGRGVHTEDRSLALADVAVRDLMDRPAAICELGPRPESARAARDFTRITLREWGLAAQSDTAELVVSELVTNALQHGLLSAPRMRGEHPVGLRLLRSVPYLVWMVTDPGHAAPVRIEACAGAESGRGLQVVESCSVRWGWQPLGDGGLGSQGKVVWALLHSAELPWVTGRSEPRCTVSGGPVRRAGRRTRHPWLPGGTRRSRLACR
jgi:anti-sigma regulatory factor (Ser/Thr protein kinase)